MSMSRTGWLAAVVATCLVFSGATAWAQKADEKKTEKKAEKAVEMSDAEKTAEVVEQLGLAAELTAFGRGELADSTGVKGVMSPEALVAAGGILLRVHKQTGGKVSPSDAKVMDEDGQAVAEDGEATESLADEAAALFDEARALPTKDKAALEAQIRQAQTVPERGVVVGPRVVNRVITTNKVHTVHMGFRPNAPAAVTVRSTGRTHFEVVGKGGGVVWHSKGPNGVYNWHPAHGGQKDVKLRVINKGGPAVKYKVFAN